MMSDQTDRFELLREELNLSHEEFLVYSFLFNENITSALRISKHMHIGRTKVYRILDKLTDMGLVEQVLGPRGFLFKNSSPHNLSHLIHKKVSKVQQLEKNLPEIIDTLAGLNRSADDAKVRYYKGREGLEQVTWNSLKAEKDLYIFELSSTMESFTTQDFAEEVRGEIVRRRIHVKQLTNLVEIPDYTEVIEKVKKYWEVRHIDKRKLNITFEVVIYNDVVAMYDFSRAQPFCVEIKDPKLSAFQKGQFQFIWQQAQPMKVISPKGHAVVA